jgi:hypothetical protein
MIPTGRTDKNTATTLPKRVLGVTVLRRVGDVNVSAYNSISKVLAPFLHGMCAMPAWSRLGSTVALPIAQQKSCDASTHVWRKPMTTLTQPGLSSLIDRLFAEADAAEHSRWPAAADDRGDYRQYYGQLKDQPLPVSRATAKPLWTLGPTLTQAISCPSKSFDLNVHVPRGGLAQRPGKKIHQPQLKQVKQAFSYMASGAHFGKAAISTK